MSVHEICSWRDLKNPLDLGRRCYTFLHPRTPSVPLIFVELALVEGLVGSVQRLLDQKAPVMALGAVDTAVSYSTANYQLL